MAGDWIKWQRGLSRKPEVLRMSAKLQRSRHEIAALLMEVWEWTDEQVADPDEDGNAIVRIESGQVRAFIDHLTGLLGFADAMSAEKWIEFRSAHVAFPNWGRHNGKSAKRRALDAERKRSERSGDEGDGPKMSASKADKKRTRGEKSIPIRSEPSSGDRTSESEQARLREASAEFAGEIGNREALAAMRVTPSDPGGGASLRSCPGLERHEVLAWWRRHVGQRSPLTGRTLLDALLVLCWAAACRKSPKKIASKLAAFGAGIASGKWLESSEGAGDEWAWLREQVEAGRVEIKQEASSERA